MNKKELEQIVKNAHYRWKNKIPATQKIGLNAPVGEKSMVKRGNGFEKKVLNRLKDKGKKDGWIFTQPPKSETPVDIYGSRETKDAIYFLLVQVKGGKYVNLKTRTELKSFPFIKEYLKLYHKEKKVKKQVRTTSCYMLVPDYDGFKNKIAFDMIDPTSIRSTKKLIERVAVKFDESFKKALKNGK